ncbi:uncharacterized protein DS421_11g341790 [Arachis hypogaea]|nr:uncharacterized protein DS421_11g341790 [Arachis hypogaea]
MSAEKSTQNGGNAKVTYFSLELVFAPPSCFFSLFNFVESSCLNSFLSLLGLSTNFLFPLCCFFTLVGFSLRYNQKMIKRNFTTNDFILIQNDIGIQKSGEGKLVANRKGPYKIVEVLGRGYYKVSDLQGRELPRLWNTCNLRKYYS